MQATTSPVIIVDDDTEDLDLIKEAWKDLKFTHPLLCFKNAEEILAYMHSGKALPFLILSDIHLPRIDGFELKKRLSKDKATNAASIPFVFISGTASEKEIARAYEVCAHGFFIKPESFDELKNSLKEIVAYWGDSKIPAKQS
jgi:CheY-like chemotaxis protein